MPEGAPVPAPSADELRRDRESRARRSTLALVSSRGLSMATRLVVVPMSLQLLGPARYGLWASVWSLMTWLGISDAGIGVGLLNAIGRAKGKDDRAQIRVHLATAVAALAIVSGLVLLAVATFAAYGPVDRLLGVGADPALSRDAKEMALAAGVVIALVLWTNVVPQTLTGLQEQYAATYATMAGSVGVVAALLLVSVNGATPALFAFAVGLPPVLANVLLGAYVLWRRHPELRFRLRDASSGSLRELMHVGGLAFAVQLGDIAVLQSSNVLISNRLGPAAVTPFAVTFSLLYSLLAVVSYFVTPLWPAYTEAWARGDVVWIRRRFRRSVAQVVVLISVALLGVVGLGRPFIRVWAGPGAVPSWPLLLALCAYFFAWSMNSCVGVLASGLRLFGYRALAVATVGSVFVGGSWWLLPRWGVVAVPIVGCCVMGVEALVAWIQASRRLYCADRAEVQT